MKLFRVVFLSILSEKRNSKVLLDCKSPVTSKQFHLVNRTDLCCSYRMKNKVYSLYVKKQKSYLIANLIIRLMYLLKLLY